MWSSYLKHKEKELIEYILWEKLESQEDVQHACSLLQMLFVQQIENNSNEPLVNLHFKTQELQIFQIYKSCDY